MADTYVQTGLFDDTSPEILDGVNNPPIKEVRGDSWTDIGDRYVQFERMLTALGSMSQLSGLELAAEGTNRARLEQRYDDVDSLMGRSAEAKEGYLRGAKQAFAHIYGYGRLLDAAQSQEERDAIQSEIASAFDREVIQFFADSDNAERRKYMNRWLNHNNRLRKGWGTRRPKVDRPNLDGVTNDYKPVLVHPQSVTDQVEAPRRKIDPKEVMLEALEGHRVAGVGSRNMARIRGTVGDKDTVTVFQGSNGSAVIKVPSAYAQAVADALDRGAKEADIARILRTNSPVMSATISPRGSNGRPRRVARLSE